MIEIGQVDAVIGMQRGDEAKARWIVELLGTQEYSTVARFNGADNAGHTSDIDGGEINLHQVPMGILFPNIRNLITRTSLVNPASLMDEIDYLRSRGLTVDQESLGISHAAHLIVPGHILFDTLREDGADQQGSTKRGISFASSDKYERSGVRVEDLFTDSGKLEETVIRGLEEANRRRKEVGKPEVDVYKTWREWYKKSRGLARYVTDTTAEIRDVISDGGKRILAEGAQSVGLDIDAGTYPYVTSSSTGIAGVQSGLGIGPRDIGNVFGAVKAIKSSVGAPISTLPTHMDEDLEDQIRGEKGKIDTERGKSTDRERKLCHLDIPELRTAIRANSVSEVFLAKLDWIPKVGAFTLIAESYSINNRIVMFAPSDSSEIMSEVTPNYIEVPTWDEPISHIRKFEDLPDNAQRYVETAEKLIATPITKIGVGPYRGEFISRPQK